MISCTFEHYPELGKAVQVDVIADTLEVIEHAITFRNWKIPLTFCSTTMRVLNYNAYQLSKEKYHRHDTKDCICKSRILFLVAVFMEVIGNFPSDCWYEYKAAWWYPAIC